MTNYQKISIDEIVATAKAAMSTVIPSVTIAERIRSSLDFFQYIENYRTITLGLPRQIGKTTYALKAKDQESSLMFVHNHNMKQYCLRSYIVNDPSNIFTFAEMQSPINFVPRSRPYDYDDKNFKGLKYSLIIIDEYSFMSTKDKEAFHDLLSLLHSRRLLTADFFVLQLGTPVI